MQTTKSIPDLADLFGITKSNSKNRYHCPKKENHQNGDENPSLLIYDSYFECQVCGASGNYFDFIKWVKGFNDNHETKQFLKELSGNQKSNFSNEIRTKEKSQKDYHCRVILNFEKTGKEYRFVRIDSKSVKSTNPGGMIAKVKEELRKQYSVETFEKTGIKFFYDYYYPPLKQNVSLMGIDVKNGYDIRYNTDKTNNLIIEGLTDYLTAIELNLDEYFNILFSYNKTKTGYAEPGKEYFFILDKHDTPENKIRSFQLTPENKARFFKIPFKNIKDLSDLFNVYYQHNKEKTVEYILQSYNSIDYYTIPEPAAEPEIENRLSSFQDLKDEILRDLINLYRYDRGKSKYYNLINRSYVDSKFILTKINQLIESNGIYKTIQKDISNADKGMKAELARLVKKEINTIKQDILVEITENHATSITPYSIGYGISKLKEHEYFFEIEDKTVTINKNETPYFELPVSHIRYSNPQDIIENTSIKYFADLFPKEIQQTALLSHIQWLCNIAKSYHGIERTNPYLIVISGKQHIGKDKVIFRILASVVNEKYIKENLKAEHITDEKNFENMGKLFIGNFPEMENFTRTDVTNIKSFITNKDLSYRKLHTTLNISLSNLINLYGTTNEESLDRIYRDTTGERRFVFLPLRKDLTYEKVKEIMDKVDVNEIISKIDYVNFNESKVIEAVRPYQELTRAKTIEEEFIDDFLEYVEAGESDYDCFRSEAINIERVKSSELYKQYKAYCKENGKDKFVITVKSFGKRVKPFLLNCYTYDENNRVYKQKKL